MILILYLLPGSIWKPLPDNKTGHVYSMHIILCRSFVVRSERLISVMIPYSLLKILFACAYVKAAQTLHSHLNKIKYQIATNKRRKDQDCLKRINLYSTFAQIEALNQLWLIFCSNSHAFICLKRQCFVISADFCDPCGLLCLKSPENFHLLDNTHIMRL